jgi:hypothetical protein
MSEYPNEPIVPGSRPEMSLIDTWMDAFTKPREETYARIVAQPRANATNAFLWVFIASLVTSLVSLVASLGGQMETFRQMLPPEIANQLAGRSRRFGWHRNDHMRGASWSGLCGHLLCH